MPRRRRPTAALVAAVLALAGCGDAAPVVLGISTSAAYVDAARLALDHARADGLVVPVDTVIIPEATNLSVPALRAAERFVSRAGLIAVVGHSNSAASLTASQVYNREGVVQIAPTASALVYSQAGPFSFRLVPPDDRQGAFLAGVVARELPRGSSVAVLYVNDEYGRGLRDAFRAALRGSGVEAPLDLPFVETDLSDDAIRQAVGTLARARPDAVLWLARGTTLVRMLGPIRDALGPVPIIGGDALGSARQLAAAGEGWEGVRYAEFGDLDATPEGRRFRRDYEDRFGAPATVAAALTYDATRMVLDGIESGARSGEALRAYLEALGRGRAAHAGATGPAAFDEHGDIRTRPYRLVPVLPEPLR